jgi:hypothetical protein
VPGLTFDGATERLVSLARANGGEVTAAQVEADELLSAPANRDLVSAAARALSGSTNVFSTLETDGHEWFPYSSLIFSELR